jgi:hypothetical protein
MWNQLLRATLLMALVNACTGASHPTIRSAKVTRYPSGNLRTVQEFIQDTIQDGTYVRFYEDVATIEIEIPYSQNRKHGLQSAYYKGGQVESRLYFVNGHEEGQARWYYENGSLASWVTFRHGLKLSPGLTYYDSGEFKAAIAYGDSSQVVYRVDFGKDGAVLKEGGVQPACWTQLVEHSRALAEAPDTAIAANARRNLN